MLLQLVTVPLAVTAIPVSLRSVLGSDTLGERLGTGTFPMAATNSAAVVLLVTSGLISPSLATAMTLAVVLMVSAIEPISWP